MGIARIQPGVTTLGGRVYVVGGEQGSQILANGEVYDPQVCMTNMPQQAAFGHMLFVLHCI